MLSTIVCEEVGEVERNVFVRVLPPLIGGMLLAIESTIRNLWMGPGSFKRKRACLSRCCSQVLPPPPSDTRREARTLGALGHRGGGRRR